jgi:putative acetyltransferase
MTATVDNSALLVRVRRESRGDISAIRKVNRAAFGRSVEADLVDALRRGSPQYHSWVAEVGGSIVGHILFTPAAITAAEGKQTAGAGLGPLAVLPDRQRRGIGSALVRAGLEEMRVSGTAFVVLVGHPGYYPRFGFKRASEYGLRCEFDQAPDDAFLIRVFQPAAMVRGTVRFRPEFAAAVAAGG